MWFLKGQPTNIDVRALVSSINGGYQQTSYRFNISAKEGTTVDGKVWVAFAIPWAPHKKNGSFKIVEKDTLSLLEDTVNVTTLTENDIEIWERLRALKVQPNIELIHVQELINWHLDDIGVVTFWAETDKTFQLNYTHKIAADSCLFLPTRLPSVIASRNPTVNAKMWVVNGRSYDLPPQLVKDTHGQILQDPETVVDSLDCYTFKEWGWDEDTRIHTENWDSSDDDLSSSEE